MLFIIDECINCDACAFECPVEAIYKPGSNWIDGDKIYSALSDEHYFIVNELCNTCNGFGILKCIEICPMDAINQVV